MPSPDSIQLTFTFLQATAANGVPADLAACAVAWAMVLGDMTDEDLSRAALAHARGPRSAWWPTPGELLQLVQPPAPQALTDTQRVDRSRAARATASRYWELILLAARDSTHPPERYGDDEVADRIIRRGLGAAGGLRAIGQADIYRELPQLRREAVQVMAALVAEAPPPPLKLVPKLAEPKGVPSLEQRGSR